MKKERVSQGVSRVDRPPKAPNLEPTVTSESELEARRVYRKLKERIQAFQADLKAGEELHLETPSAPRVRILAIAKTGEVFSLAGLDSDGRDVIVAQHYTHVSLRMSAHPLPKGESPHKIGFLGELKD